MIDKISDKEADSLHFGKMARISKVSGIKQQLLDLFTPNARCQGFGIEAVHVKCS